MLPQVYLLFIHWVGDYRLQYANMAIGKGKSIYWLNVHVAVYTLVLTVGTIGLWLVTDNYELVDVCKFIFVNAILHWITDYITSRIANYYREKGDDRHYWVSGFDQFIHSITILLTHDYILI